MKEIVLIPTFRRDPLLYVCLKRLREVYNGEVLICSDKGHYTDDLVQICFKWNAQLSVLGKHDGHGNTRNAGEALKFAYDAGYERIHYLEDDCLVNERWYRWTYDTHASPRDIFCSAGWVGNRDGGFVDFTYFLPWIYIPQFTIKRDKLALIARHLHPEYYGDMRGYIQRTFPNSPLKNYSQTAINHYEIDGLIQHIIMEDQGCQVAWNLMPTVMHGGFGGYNRGGYEYFDDFFRDCDTFEEKVAKVEKLADDPYWRAQLFGRRLVECETGPLPKRGFKYRITLPGGWESYLETELEQSTLPPILNSVRIPSNAKITLISRSG